MSLTDANGNETSSYSYDPFGNRVAGAGSAEAMFQFAGGYRMPNGLYHFGQRYYDPVVGRFTQQDPRDQVGDLRQGNRYLYAGDDPVNFVDPSGELVPALVVAGAVRYYSTRWAAKQTGRYATQQARKQHNVITGKTADTAGKIARKAGEVIDNGWPF